MARPNDKVIINVYRYDPDTDREPHFDRYEIAVRPGMTVLQALLDILDYQDGSLSLRYSCREAICGSCAMYINGVQRLACKTQVNDVGPEITVSPLPNQPVLKDLVVDMSSFFEKYKAVKPWLVHEKPPEKEILQAPEDRATIDMPSICILCGACYSACPTVWTNKNYLGPAALLKAYRFICDSRDEHPGRLDLVDHEEGIYRCHTAFNCVEACPKGLDPNFAIQMLKKLAAKRLLKIG